MNKHPNTKEVVAHRLQPFNHEAQKGLDEWFANANVSIGSYFQKGGSKRVATGLEDWEASQLLPMMVNAEATDKDFKEKVEKYYIDINTKIPSGGLVLEIGLTEDNSKAIMYKDASGEKVKNYPINLEDYLIYRHVIGHPHVASNKEEGLGNPLVRFYIEDKSKVSSQLVKDENLKDQALTLYLEVAKDENKVSMYLALLGVSYKSIVKEERPAKLKALANSNSQLFIDTINDKDATTKFFVQRMVSASIVHKEGGRYLYEGNELGSTLIDFVLYLQDKANSETVGIMKARLKELAN